MADKLIQEPAGGSRSLPRGRSGAAELAGRLPPLATGLAVFLVLAASLGAATLSYIETMKAREEAGVLHAAATIRARLESELYERISLERGLVSYLELDPDIDQKGFEAFTRSLIRSDPLVRNIALLKDTTISHIYPLEGNAAALGRDLAQVAGQRDGVLFVKESRGILVAGPVELVQGGRGVVSRMAIEVEGRGGAREYWGQASLVIAVDRLFEEAGTFGNPAVRVALANGASSTAVFEGDAAVFSSDPVLMDVHFSGGHWTLAAIPASGWKDWLPTSLAALFGIACFAGLNAWLAASFVETRTRMRDMAYHDPLTGLPNRMMLRDRLAIYLALARRQGGSVVLGMLDLDGFKEINDRLGHSAGDEALVEVARRLREGIRASDSAARLGGDEFVIVSALDTDSGSLPAIEQRILSFFEEPFAIAGKPLRIGASLGLAVWPDDGQTVEELLALADARMYRRKRAGEESSLADDQAAAARKRPGSE
jgi:diguanylate cyclase (GGDEF)-like protein